MFAYTPQAGDIVVDVGAGSGLEALPFSRRVSATGRVIAIEAHPLMFRCLEEVCRLNHLTNVTPIHAAVGATNDDVLISDSPNYQANTTITDAGVKVSGRTLDSIIASLAVERIDLLKMNIEGAERAALDGMARTIEITRHVAIGCHDFLADWGRGEQMRTRSVVEEFLRRHDFDLLLRDDKREWLRDTIYGRRRSPRGTR
jgi:FkbM family methyltransferase